MPSLKVFGKQWNVSSDDVPIPGTFLLVFHITWTIVIAASSRFLISGSGATCDEAYNYQVYAIVLLACFCAACLVEVVAIREGLKGSLFEEERRRLMPHLVMAHALVSAVTVGVNVWGSVLLYDLRDVCAREGLEFESAGVFKVLVWFTWAVLILCAVLAIVPLQLVPSESSGYGAWERRWTIISWLCCCRRQLTTAPEGEARPLERLSQLFSNFFRHADFTSSDVAVTVYLANVLQRLRRRRAIEACLNGEAGNGTSDAHEARQSSGSSTSAQQLLGQRDVDVVLSKRAFSARANGMTLYTEARNRGAGVADAAHRLLCASHVASAMARELPGDSVDLHRRYCKPGTPASAADMDAASRFAPYAMASYGALYYVYIHPRPERLAELCCSGCCPLLLGRWGYSGPDGGPMVESPRRFVLSKSSAVLNKTAICEIANVARKDLCYVNSENRFNEQAPYFVALDRASKTIVVSIRGTLSLDDTMTDLMCHPADFSEWTQSLDGECGAVPELADEVEGAEVGSAKECGAEATQEAKDLTHDDAAGHSGIMKLSAHVVRDLARHRLLFKLLCHDGENAGGRSHTSSARNLSHQHGMCEGWRIAVTGHSLGAGIAAFVAMHLRRRYCRVQGWCFSPPGWLMTPELANKTRSFITSVVVNKDLIPRLTLRSLEHLRDDLVYAGVRCKYSKARVVTGTVCGGGCCWAGRRKSWAKLEAMFNPESCGATDGARDFLSSYRRSVAEHVTDREFDTLQSFRLPGNVLFMRCLKTKRKQPLAAKQWEAIWISADDLAEEGLLLSKHMLMDHLPDRTIVVIKRARDLVLERERNGDTATDDAGGPAPSAFAQRSQRHGGRPSDIALVDVPAAPDAVARAGQMRRAGSVTDVRSRRAPASGGGSPL